MKKVKKTQPKERFGKWISAKENKPEPLKNVLIQYESGHIEITWCDFDGVFLFEELYGRAIAWMPLPEPYKSKSK